MPRHRAFIRVRSSYVLGSDPDARCLPQDYRSRAELDFVTDVVCNIVRHSAALCYFNPNGEVVAPVAVVEKNLTYHRQHDLPPLNVWANVRLLNLTENWLLMDTVGNRQLDIADQEAVFPSSAFKPQEMDNFLRNASLYILKNGPLIKDGDTMDGPEGSLWRAITFENGLNDPPREVLSWLPANATKLPAAIKDRKRKTSTPLQTSQSQAGRSVGPQKSSSSKSRADLTQTTKLDPVFPFRPCFSVHPVFPFHRSENRRAPTKRCPTETES